MNSEKHAKGFFMQGISNFIKTTAAGGLFILLPILLFYLLFAEILELFIGLATPIADLFPEGTFDQAKFPVLIAILLLAAVSFIIGLATRSSAGKRFGNWFESITIGRLPMYNALKTIFTGFTSKNGEDAFRPALLKSPDGDEFAYVVEDLGNGKAAVLIPWAPTPFAGSVKIVSQERLELLEISLGELTTVLSHWGVGAGQLTGKNIDTGNSQ
ncbi:hypothetical protein ACFLZL_01000 [Thermodesulfobacteriota bacterium]